MSNNVWLTADTHLGHCNIIKYCKRPFASFEDMNEGIIQRFVEVLRPGDSLGIPPSLCYGILRGRFISAIKKNFQSF